MLKNLKQWRAYFYIFPVLLLLSACNDSSDDHSAAQPDGSKKPVMRCAP